MTINLANFDTDTAVGTLTGFTLPTATVIRQLGGVARTTSATGTVIALANKAPAGLAQFSRLQLTNNLGSSVSVLLRASHNGTETGYLVRHNGADLAIIKLVNGTSTALANVAHTRAAGTYLEARITDEANPTITAYVMPAVTDPPTADPAPLLSFVDTTPITTKGTVGFRSSATSDVQFGEFAGGDLAERSSVVAGADNMTSFVVITPTGSADLILPWRGLRFNRAGEMLVLGERLHHQTLDFWGLSGAYVAPSGWATAGTATLSSPNGGIGFLELATDATIGAVASLSCSVPISSTAHGAILIEANGLHFSAANPVADFRIGATGPAKAGASLTQLSTGASAFLASNDEEIRTTAQPSLMHADAARRRPVGLLISPSTKEAWMLERDKVVAYHDGTSGFSGGSLTVTVSVTARAAAVQRLRMTSLSVSTFA